MPPTTLHCPASSAKQIACPAARDSSLVTWLFSPFHQPRSSEGFTRGERLHKVMETRQRNREAIASNQLQRRGGCNEAWSVTRKNHRPVFAFSSPFFILLPYLFFLLLIIRKKKRQWEERWGGADMHTEESREEKESTFLLGGKKWLKAKMNTICWFQRKEKGISRANKQSNMGRPASLYYSTMPMLAEALFLHPPFYTVMCFLQMESLVGLGYWLLKTFYRHPTVNNVTLIMSMQVSPWNVTVAANQV